ncbi:MAG: hypothetical protein ACFCUQ_04175 [Kiloniellales bacterium]
MQGFFQTLLRPDQEEDPERTLVARAANILQVGEFQLLQLAYEDWFGKVMPSKLSDEMFRAYMMRCEIPAWAQSFARWVIRQDEIGLLDGDDPQFHRFDHDYVTVVPQGWRKFVIASLLLVFLFAAALLAGELATIQVTSVLPPYFETKELARER